MGIRGSFKGLGAGQILQLGKIGYWLRLAQGTITSGGYSSVPDMLGASPAVAADAAHRPTAGASANGFPIATFSDHLLSVPLSAGNNGTTRWGFACWFKQTATATAALVGIETTAGASTNKTILILINSGLSARLDEMVTDRHAQTDTLALNTWQFLTVEVDCSQGTEAGKVLMSLNGVLQTVSFSSDTAWPSSLANPTGTAFIGGRNIGFPSNPLIGSIGPNVYFLTAQLTAAERLILMNFEVPT